MRTASDRGRRSERRLRFKRAARTVAAIERIEAAILAFARRSLRRQRQRPGAEHSLPLQQIGDHDIRCFHDAVGEAAERQRLFGQNLGERSKSPRGPL